MHIWALKTQKLPGPQPQIACFARTSPLRYVGNFRPQKLGRPLDQILDPHLSTPILGVGGRVRKILVPPLRAVSTRSFVIRWTGKDCRKNGDETLLLITAPVNKHGCRMYYAMVVKSCLNILKFPRESDVIVNRMCEMYRLFKDVSSASQPAIESKSSK